MFAGPVQMISVSGLSALSADASLACLGVVLASFWHANAYLVPFALAPIVLLHFALHLPQLREEARVDAKTGLAKMKAVVAAAGLA